MPASKASNDSMVTLLSPDPQRGVMDRKIKATVVFAVHFHGIYRTIELAGGLNGKIIFTKVYIYVLDGAMVVLAVFTLNFAHPGFLVGRTTGKNQIEFSVDAEKKDSALLGTQ